MSITVGQRVRVVGDHPFSGMTGTVVEDHEDADALTVRLAASGYELTLPRATFSMDGDDQMSKPALTVRERLHRMNQERERENEPEPIPDITPIAPERFRRVATKPTPSVPPPPPPATPAAKDPNWQVWPGNTTATASTITIDAKGIIRVSALADLALGQPDAVELLYCTNPTMIGLRSVDASKGSAIRIRRKDEKPSFGFSCRAFLAYHGITTPNTRRWKAEMRGGVLCAAISEQPIAVIERGKRGGA